MTGASRHRRKRGGEFRARDQSSAHLIFPIEVVQTLGDSRCRPRRIQIPQKLGLGGGGPRFRELVGALLQLPSRGRAAKGTKRDARVRGRTEEGSKVASRAFVSQA